ncbi:glycosylase [Spartobacteria bacterium LR76]|nr:glycosylase [Spartobacteria bacterium LR76]
MLNATQILKRHQANPIITPAHMPQAAVVFNPSPAWYQGRTVLLLSAYEWSWPEIKRARGGWVAMSDDGVHFEIAAEPLIDLIGAPAPFDKLNCTLIDARITQIENRYYINSPVYQDGEGPFTLLGMTEDFQSYQPIEIVAAPVNRVPSVFPEKIGGKYYRLERPGHDAGVSIWLSSSPDLVHWGCYRPVLKPGYSIWNITKIGPTPPIRTPEGWLVIMHGVWAWQAGASHYHIGAFLLDLEEPWKVIGKTQSWLLAPEEDYETRGTANDVVFPCGALADLEADELRVYYGAADTRVGLATGSLSAVIEACRKGW